MSATEPISAIYPMRRVRTMPPADQLYRWRTYNRLSQREAAELFGGAQSNVSRYERSEDVPTGERRDRIAEITGVEFPS